MTALQLAAGTALAEPAARTLFERVVLAIDFSSASLAAARWATTSVARHSHAIVSHVVPLTEHPQHHGSPAAGIVPIDLALPTLSGGLGGFAATLEVATARSMLRVGRPSEWLSVIANGAEASLIVLGRRGDANRKRIGEPNVIERLARRTSASVLVVPEGTMEPLRHVVAAVDESPAAANVLRVARALSQLHTCPLILLHVLSPTSGEYDRVIKSARGVLAETRNIGLAPQPPDTRSRSPAVTQWLDDLVGSDDDSGRVHVKTTIGDPAREIASVALAYGAPLVVVGKRGSDGAPPGSVGSVARELLTRAPVPVLAVGL